MGACQQKSKEKKDHLNLLENRKKVLHIKRSIQSTGKSLLQESQRTIKTEPLIKQKEHKEKCLEKIFQATQPFSRIYSILHHYKQITIGEDNIITVQHNVNTQVRQARLIKRSKENDTWIETFLNNNFDHPNIVKIYEYYCDEEHHIFVQEQMSGVILGEFIKPSEQIKENVGAQLIIQILQAVQYLHQNNFVHGRISQHAFQFASDKEPLTLKLIDYKNIFARDELNLDSLMFIAPELLTIIKEEKFTKPGDIWACGILSYTLLSNSSPYSKCKTMQNLSNQILRGAIIYDSINFDKISTAGKEFVKKLLARLQTQRPNAQQALNETWIHNFFTSRKQQQSNKETLNKLYRYRQMNDLQFRLMIHMINVFFSQTCSQLINTFNDFDLDKDGKVNMEEMITAYKAAGQKEDQLDEVKNLFEKIDSNHSGDIDFHEFLIAVIDRQALLSNANIDQTFQTLNISRNGRLNEQELSNVLQIPVEQIRDCFPQNHLTKEGKAVFDLKLFKNFMNELL